MDFSREKGTLNFEETLRKVPRKLFVPISRDKDCSRDIDQFEKDDTEVSVTLPRDSLMFCWDVCDFRHSYGRKREEVKFIGLTKR